MYSHAAKLVPKYCEDWMENVVFRRDILKMVQKHGNLAVMHARKVLPFSGSNEFSHENYLSYPCTEFGENL